MSLHQRRIVPRNGHTLIVGIGARISGCAKQKEVSNEDQIDHAKEIVADLYQGSVEFRPIATKGKGERLDRPELETIEAAFRSGLYDLFVFEDLGRLVRGAEAVRLLGIAKDHGVRVIVINDCIDTDDPNWEQDALDAASEHVGHNIHTSKRLKKKLMNRFKRNGGAPARPPFGYIIPPGVKTYDGWQKDDKAAPFIHEGARRLRVTLNGSAVADWFNSEQVITGPYCRTDTWTGAMVRRLFANTLLKGVAARGRRHTVKHHESGNRVSVPNPEGPNYWACPHLAYLSAHEFDELNRLLDAKNANSGRKPVNGKDPLLGVSRKRTRFPAPIAACWYCGQRFVWGGNGVTTHLMCNGSRALKCWNGVSFNGALAARQVTAAITTFLGELQGFDAQFRAMVEEACRNNGGGAEQRREALRQREAELARRKENIKTALGDFGMSATVREALAEIEAQEAEIARERQAVDAVSRRVLQLPASPASVQTMVRQEFERLAVDSHEMGGFLCQIVSDFHVFLVRSCDGGHLLPRARVTLNLGGLHPDVAHVPTLAPLLARTVTLDLFEPTQREIIRPEAARLTAQGLTHEKIASMLTPAVTSTAVGHALALDRKMQELGLSSPYVLVHQPPNDAKVRRHTNPKYKFQVREGYVPPPLE